MLLFALLACGIQPGKPAVSSQDVRGVYQLAWTDAFTIRLDIAGAVQEQTSSGGEAVTFEGPDGEPLVLDLATFCADDGVTCPSEVWPDAVAIDEDNPEVVADGHTLHVYDPADPATRRDGLVDHTTNRFLVALGGDSGGSGGCGALSLSLADGLFRYDGDDTGSAPVGGPVGIDDGEVGVGWLGVCAWSGLAVTATLSISTTYTGERTDDLPAPATDTGDTGG